MDDREYALISNLLDALDRLFDMELQAIDLYHLLFATACALPGSPFSRDVAAAAQVVLSAARSGGSPEEKNTAALVATDALRLQVSAAWGEGYLERQAGSELG